MKNKARFDKIVGFSDLEPTTMDKFSWVSAETHQASVSFIPLDKVSRMKTNAGLITLMAGCLILSAKRLSRIVDVSPCYNMAEAMLAYQSNPHIVPTRIEGRHEEKGDAQHNAVNSLISQASTPLFQTLGKHSKFPPKQGLKNVVFFTKHLMGAELVSPFRKWLKSAFIKLDEFAPCPDQDFLLKSKFDSEEDWLASRRKNFGKPVPIEVLSMENAPDMDNLPMLYAEFLEHVDQSRNPYLLEAVL